MPYLFLDLDNTLIYSHRHRISEAIVWVEKLHGKDQSYITGKTYSFFQKQNYFEVIPVTTRTRQQAARLEDMFHYFSWKNVLICNGSILLQDGTEEKAWTNESLKISGEDRNAYYQALESIRLQVPKESIVTVTPFMFYVKTVNTDSMLRVLEKKSDQSRLLIYKDSRKLYCLPKALNKGAAIRRYMNRFGRDSCVAAGDSAFDLSMLNIADMALYPEALKDFVHCKNGKLCEGIFSDAICTELRELSNEVK